MLDFFDRNAEEDANEDVFANKEWAKIPCNFELQLDDSVLPFFNKFNQSDKNKSITYKQSKFEVP